MIAAIVVALAVIVTVLATRGETVTVPNVVGTTQAEAAAALQGAGLKVGRVSQDPAAQAKPGQVVSQAPAAGAKIDEGGTVDLVIAAVPLVEVPKVVGLDRAAAETTLKEAGLAIGTVTQRQTADVEPGVVLEQTPTAGKQANKGSTVDLVEATAALAKIPNVVGRPLADAKAAIEAVGLKVGKVTEKESTNVAPGVVSKQSPDAGSEVNGGSAVDLEVGTAPKVKVPTVTGASVSEAVIALARAGLSLGDVQHAFDPAVAAGFVKSQDPGEGTSLPVGSKVGLVVSKGTQSGTVPDVVGLTEADATLVLEADGFVVQVSRVVSADVAPGLVVTQAPAAEAQAAPGSTVTIEVSKGDSPTAKTVVPDVVGLDVAKALKVLNDAKLRATFQFVTSEQFLVVTEQDPIAQTEVDPGTTVLVSLGIPAP